MTKPMHRNKRFRKVFRRMPGGKTIKKHFRRKTHKKACMLCCAVLRGNKPGRKYSGQLCPACTCTVVVAKTRLREGTLKTEEISPRLKKFL